jgi:hypothetical protein
VEQGTIRGRLLPRILVAVAVTVAVSAALAAAPQRAPAQRSYVHGGIGIDDCGACHLNGHTEKDSTAVVSEVCLDCHKGYQLPHRGQTCWTCHTPGQDMSSARSDASCTTTCHLFGGSTVTHAAHPGRSTACTSCHPLSASPSDPAGSPHHTAATPVISTFAPGAGLPGTTVTLTGSHFTDVSVVSFNGAWSAFVVASDTQLTATVPAKVTSGLITVIAPGGTVLSARAFVVTVAPGLTLRADPAIAKAAGRVRLSGRLTPLSLAGADVTVTVQAKKGGIWRTVKTAFVGTTPSGAYGWWYRPPHKGSYRAITAIGETPANLAAQTPPRGFRVR